ncbi:MAG: acyl-CoA dehydrogenase family protein [Bryobacterales bacterium]
MDFDYSPKVRDLQARVMAFMDEHVYPNERRFAAEIEAGDRWQPTSVIEELKAEARKAGLWNLFLPESDLGAGLSNLEYAPLCEIMGRSAIGPEVFNCSPPDTGNMEVLVRYGTPEQKKQWLEPLLAGEIRSCFCMTEPDVASSDATNIRASIEREGDEYVVNGKKWWSSGGGDPRCKISIFMGKTDPGAPKHKQQSMILVAARDAGSARGACAERAGLAIMRQPHGRGDSNLRTYACPHRTFCLAKGAASRLRKGGWDRDASITACARSKGARAGGDVQARVQQRGVRQALAEHGTIRADIAKSRIEIDQARLLVAARRAHDGHSRQ